MRLITQHLQSVGALDLLLLLHGARDRDWSVAELCLELLCPPRWAEAQLRRLAEAGLAAGTGDGRHRYQRGHEYGPAVDELARACRRDRAAVTRQLFTRLPR